MSVENEIVDLPPIDDSHDAVKLIKALFRPDDLILTRPIETYTEDGRRKSKVDYNGICYDRYGGRNGNGWAWHDSKMHVSLCRSIGRTETTHCNLFFGVAPRVGPGGQYDQKFQIRTVNALWSDIDDGNNEEVLDRCSKAGLPIPSIVVNSGRGVHFYWLLDEPFRIDDADKPPAVHDEWIEKKDGQKVKDQYFWSGSERVYLKKDGKRIPANEPPLSSAALLIEDVLKGIASKIGGDHTTDLARLLRYPGTLNRKDQRNGRVPLPSSIAVLDTDRRYSIDVFLPLAEASPDRERREKIKAVKLKAPRRLTENKENRINELLLICSTAPVGDRSDADFSLCCYAIEHAISSDDVWRLAQGVGKFAEQGERYFQTTWSKAESHAREEIYSKVCHKSSPKPKNKVDDEAAAKDVTGDAFGNVEFIAADDGGQQAEPLPIQRVIANLVESVAGAKLHKTGGKLFAHNPGDLNVDWLLSTASLFGWLQAVLGTINWSRGNGYCTKDEFTAELLRVTAAVFAIERIPHHPPVKDHYYLCSNPSPGDGSSLASLISRYLFASDLDRELATAMFVTGVWGGPSGTRPAYLITAQAGRGKGKSTLAQHFAQLYGGSIDISPNEDITKIKSRLLSSEAKYLRIGLLDNLKSPRFSWGEFEALLTSVDVNGWEAYVGDSRRPNLFTWTITLNGASLSTDMSQRVVEIRLGEPVYRDSWEDDTRKFIEERRELIIADCVAFLQRPASAMRRHTRWATWEAAVLARCERPDDCLDLIVERRGAVDVEQEESEIIESYFANKLESLDYDVQTADVFIPNDIAAKWYNAATGDSKKVTGVTRALKQLHDEKKIHRLTPCRNTERSERGVRWCGHHADASDSTAGDIRYRIAKKTEEQQQKNF